jgi:integrase/recombinase XerD
MQKKHFSTNRKTLRKGKKLSSHNTSNFHQPMDLTFTEMFEKFIQFKRSEALMKVTIDDHYRYFRYFLEYTNGDLEKDDIKLDIFYGYINYMLHEKGLSPFTINVRVRPLRALLRYCFLEGYIDTPIHERFKLVKTEDDTIQSFTTTEVNSLIANIDETFYAGFRNKIMVLTLLDTMVRITELLKMKRSNVDLKSGYYK